MPGHGRNGPPDIRSAFLGGTGSAQAPRSSSSPRWPRVRYWSTATNNDFVVIRSAGTNPIPPALNRGRPMSATPETFQSDRLPVWAPAKPLRTPFPPVDLLKQETPIMADAPPPQAIKTVRKPRDQHLRDMADCIRFLSMDAVQQAKSGHPGAPMGMADIATVLFRDFTQFDAADPHLFDPDRFVLSNRHTSMLPFILLSLTLYPDIALDRLTRVRQNDSK